METALVLARLGQYLAAAGLFGGALFLARQPQTGVGVDRRGERVLLLGSAATLVCATLAALVLATATMAGRSDPFVDPGVVGLVLRTTAFGHAIAVRLLAAAAAAVVVRVASSRIAKLWSLTALGAVATVTLAWGGHGAADEGALGWIHLGADLVHLVAAALWIGALAALLPMALDRRPGTDPAFARRLRDALEGFAGMGTLAVALLIVSGVFNAAFMIGPDRIVSLVTTLYGRLLLIKLALFGVMLAFAATNRWRLTPGLAASARAAPALAALRRSLVLETTAAVAVLALVAWLGRLAPPAAG